MRRHDVIDVVTLCRHAQCSKVSDSWSTLQSKRHNKSHALFVIQKCQTFWRKEHKSFLVSSAPGSWCACPYFISTFGHLTFALLYWTNFLRRERSEMSMRLNIRISLILNFFGIRNVMKSQPSQPPDGKFAGLLLAWHFNYVKIQHRRGVAYFSRVWLRSRIMSFSTCPINVRRLHSTVERAYFNQFCLSQTWFVYARPTVSQHL